ncbi:hypothetical protein Ahy_A04g020780 [Arachis hypogaea]|uniref:Ubiquitin-like protease family profile domain-containing protein n=1 Tax=Arachis hypogaea TaxID=3818 RepID=A0A445DIJ2_ARAHY|nr:hypothetical protein Ahy_A04g020780 [Arachis hypogaea]
MQITSTNSSSILDPPGVVQSSESTKTSDLTSILPIQPKMLFHSDITREATTPSNGQPNVREGAILLKVINLVALIMTRVFRHRNEDPIYWFMPEYFARYALSDKYKPAEVILDFLRAYMSLKVSHVIRVFIPIYEEQHWYLVIVDFTSCRLILLDSLSLCRKTSTTQKERN